MADIFRAPVIAPRRDGPARAAAFDPPNLLLSVLVLVAPFHGVDTPTPRPVPYVHQQSIPRNLLLSTTPFIPNATFGPAVQSAKAASFDPPDLLFSTLKPIVVGTPFIPNMPPSPAGPLAKAASFDPPNPLASVFLATFPNQNWQWPSATPRQPKATAFDVPNILATTLGSVFPIQNWQWPSPNPPLPKVAAYDPPNLPLAVLVPTRPFQAFVWPNPYQMPPPALAFDPPFPNPPPPAPPDVTPQGGHWLAPTKAELERIRREAAEARSRQEAEWAQAIKDRETLHAQVMASLHPEKGAPLPEATVAVDDDEEDIEILLLNG